MNKKGFTLIELLAVIVILAIIALIAVPIVLGIIDDAKKSSVVRSGEFYIKGLELAIANSALTPDTQVRDGEYSIINGNVCLGTIAGTGENRTCNGDLLEVEINGEVPSEGLVAISNGQVAYVEGLKIGNTKISSSVEGLIESENRVVCQAVTEKTRLKDKHYAFSHIDESYNTVLSSELTYIGNIPEGKYEPGDEYLCEVKPGTTYRFYVLSTDGDNINLIMEQNITSKGTPATETDTGTVAWINEADYQNAGGTNWNWTSELGDRVGYYDKGPITAMNYLINATSTWSNISEQTYNFEVNNIAVPAVLEYANQFLESEDPNTEHYANGSYIFNYTAKARLILVEEAYVAGCKFGIKPASITYFQGACPLWLSNNLQYKNGAPEGATVIKGIRGYWALNVIANTGNQNVAFDVYDRVQINSEYIHDGSYNGVRPVITLDKKYVQ